MGGEHVRNLLALGSQVQVAAIADNHPPSIDATLRMVADASTPVCAAGIKVFQGATAARDMLQAGVCDVCIISTPNHSHFEVLLEVFEHAPKVSAAARGGLLRFPRMHARDPD
jgi:predicted dehydrogenase